MITSSPFDKNFSLKQDTTKLIASVALLVKIILSWLSALIYFADFKVPTNLPPKAMIDSLTFFIGKIILPLNLSINFFFFSSKKNSPELIISSLLNFYFIFS